MPGNDVALPSARKTAESLRASLFIIFLFMVIVMDGIEYILVLFLKPVEDINRTGISVAPADTYIGKKSKEIPLYCVLLPHQSIYKTALRNVYV